MSRIRIWLAGLMIAAGLLVGVGVALANPPCDPGTGTCSIASPMDQSTPEPTNSGIPVFPTPSPTIGLPPTLAPPGPGDQQPDPFPTEALPQPTQDSGVRTNCDSPAVQNGCPNPGAAATPTMNPDEPPVPEPGQVCERTPAGKWECRDAPTPVNQGSAGPPDEAQPAAPEQPAQPAQPAEPADQPTTSDANGDVATDANPDEAQPSDTSDAALAADEATEKAAYDEAKKAEKTAWDEYRRLKGLADTVCEGTDTVKSQACADARRSQWDAEDKARSVTYLAEHHLYEWARIGRRRTAWRSVENAAASYRNTCSREQILANQGLIGLCRGKLEFVRATKRGYHAT